MYSILDEDNNLVAYVDNYTGKMMAAVGYKIVSDGVIVGDEQFWTEDDINAGRKSN